MHARHSLFFASMLLALTACTNIPTDTGRASRVTIINGDFPVLTQGMTTAEVRQRLGEPAEIQPMASPVEATAEVWVYYLEKSLGRFTVVTGLTGGCPTVRWAATLPPVRPRPGLHLGRAETPRDPAPAHGQLQLSVHSVRSEERMEF